MNADPAERRALGIEHTNRGLVTFGGGVVPRDEAGEAIGAIGVSAGSVEQDVAVAKAGAAALRK